MNNLTETEVISKRDLIRYRRYKPEDHDFILSTWLRGAYYGNSWYSEIDRESYFQHYNRYLNKLLQDPSIVVRVACLVEDEDVILGYSVVQNDILHFVFCKSDWRKIGLAKDLIPDTIKFITHLTELGKKLWKTKRPEWKFNPFLH